MRVVHLAAVDAQGGAARAAFRLHHGLLQAGLHSSMLVKDKSSTSESVHVAPRPDLTDAFFWDLIETYYLGLNRTPISNTYFSIGAPGLDLSQHPLVKEAGLLHLHWVADFQSPASIARLQALGKPIVWTLHDPRPFTGGCHFSAGCARYQKDCARCPQLDDDPLGVPNLNLQDQLQLLSPGAICVVAPSRWLAACARQSALFARSRIEVIPYGLETDRFCPRPRAEAKTKLCLSPGGFHFLFGADYGSEKRKGFAELLAALQLCWHDQAFRQKIRRGEVGLLAFGRPHEEFNRLPFPIKFLGYLKDDESLSWLYSAADLFIVPSLEDNLPNTALEAMSCGTPLLAFNVGGLPDLVQPGRTGQLIDWTGDSLSPAIDSFSHAILSLAAQPRQCEPWRKNCREQITSHFSVPIQAQRYLDLYTQLCLKTPAQAPLRAVQAEIGPHLHAIYPHLLLHALQRFATRIKGASAAERKTCRQLIQALQSGSAPPEKIHQLKTTLMAAETDRLARRMRRHHQKSSANTGITAFFKKLLPHK